MESNEGECEVVKTNRESESENDKPTDENPGLSFVRRHMFQRQVSFKSVTPTLI